LLWARQVENQQALEGQRDVHEALAVDRGALDRQLVLL
jgi:hypothetical protein